MTDIQAEKWVAAHEYYDDELDVEIVVRQYNETQWWFSVIAEASVYYNAHQVFASEPITGTADDVMRAAAKWHIEHYNELEARSL
jgi:hypothetical protein